MRAWTLLEEDDLLHARICESKISSDHTFIETSWKGLERQRQSVGKRTLGDLPLSGTDGSDRPLECIAIVNGSACGERIG